MTWIELLVMSAATVLTLGAVFYVGLSYIKRKGDQ